jgi:hypothetical protein
MQLHKRKKKATEAAVPFFIALHVHKRKKKATVAVVAFFIVLLRCTTKQEEEEGDSVAIVTFFAVLHSSAIPQEDEEGGGSYCRLLRYAITQQNKTRGKRRQRCLLRCATLQCSSTRRRRR